MGIASTRCWAPAAWAKCTARTTRSLYVARAADWSGPWLWALDVESKVARRVTVGLEQYTSVSASRDGRRVVATVAKPTASLWRVALNDRLAEDVDAQPYRVSTERALAPRHRGASLFYLSLSTRGIGDRLWRFHNGEAFEVTKGADNMLSEPPVVSPDGSRVAIVVRQPGKRQLANMSADGTNSRTLAPVHRSPCRKSASVLVEPTASCRAVRDWLPGQRRIQRLLAARFRHQHNPTAHAHRRSRLLEYVRRHA